MNKKASDFQIISGIVVLILGIVGLVYLIGLSEFIGYIIGGALTIGFFFLVAKLS
jgi:hypothetical protein